MEVNSPSEKIVHNESAKEYTSVRFEPGIHPALFDHAGYTGIASEIFNGNLRAHSWNKEIGARVRQYAPLVLAIDGLSPMEFTGVYQSEIDNEKFNIWGALPDRPSTINTVGIVYVVEGDLVFGVSGGGIQKIVSTMSSGLYKSNSKEFVDFIHDVHGLDIDNPQQNALGFAREEMIGGMGLFSLAYLVHKAMLKTMEIQKRDTQVRKTDLTPKKSNKFSRRTLLKYIGMGFALTGTRVASLEVPIYMAAKSVDEQNKTYWQNITSALKPIFFKDDWVDARTALLICKTEDGIRSLGLPKDTPASVIIGTRHGYEADILLNDKSIRMQTIAKFMEQLLRLFDNILEKYPTIPKAIARNNLLDYVTKTNILEVKDPGGPDQNPNLPDLINDNITFKATFQSQQVEDAVKHLRVV